MSEPHIITRGVPAGYGYIRKQWGRRKGWSKFWPVRLDASSPYGYVYLRDEHNNQRYGYEREDVLQMIQREISKLGTAQ